jgi:thiol-disulfide isomerase/thioredoxin/outer membrane lipoprotein-sorting protein
MIFRFSLISRQLILLAILVPGVANGQQDPEPSSLLSVIEHNYSQSTHYHIEARLSEGMRGELFGKWSNSFQSAVLTQGGRYRFEARGPHYSWLQVSNGKTEWIYDATTQEYVQKQTLVNQKPSHFGKDQWTFEESQLIDAQGVPEHVAEELGSVRNPDVIGSEVLSLDDSDVECFVIRGQRKYQSGSLPDTKVELTFWIEKSSHYVRKIEEHWEGALIKGDTSHYTRANVEVYPVVDLSDADVPPTFFEFQPPPAAKRVVTFQGTRSLSKPQASHLLGTMAPELVFHSPDGHLVPLSSMRGTPILIEFWATWCGPCIAAFKKLEQLYSQATGHGIVVITVDEDEQPDKADAFLMAHRKLIWSNYHDDGEINRSLPGDGLPQFVLIDATGKIAYAASGFDEHELHAAFSRLGPEYSSPARQPK